MKQIILAQLVLVVVATLAFRAASWVKQKCSQRAKDRLVIALLVVFLGGMFFCYSLRFAIPLAVFSAACVTADLLKVGAGVRKKKEVSSAK